MSLINCNECRKEISDLAITCPHCGTPFKQPSIKIADVEMTFMSMVTFMVKLAFAAIPAAIIIFIITGVLAGVFAGLFHR